MREINKKERPPRAKLVPLEGAPELTALPSRSRRAGRDLYSGMELGD